MAQANASMRLKSAFFNLQSDSFEWSTGGTMASVVDDWCASRATGGSFVPYVGGDAALQHATGSADPEGRAADTSSW